MPASLALAVAALLLGSPATSTVSPTHVRVPAVAIGPGGDTAVAWEHVSSKRVVIEARVGRGPMALGSTQRFGTGARPRVAIGGDGSAALLWVAHGGRVMASIARPGHPFGPAQTLERSASPRAIVGAAIQPSGRVVAAFTAGNGLEVALARRRERFGAPRRLARVGFSPPSIALDPRDGAVIVAYPTRAKAGADAQAAVTTLTPTARAFTPPVLLTSAPTLEAAPTAIAGPGGAAVTISSTTVSLVRRGLDGRWSAPEPFAAQPDNSGKQFPEFLTSPTAALLADGSAVPAWFLQVYAPDVPDELLRGEAYAGGQLLTPAQGIASPPSAAAAGNDAFVVSAVDQGPVELFTRPAGASTFTPTILAAKGDGDAQLAAAGTHVLAAFQSADRLHLTLVR
ncbi:MAG TPA: hypothetical protein VI300_06575 [Solirubrobacter sp.]